MEIILEFESLSKRYIVPLLSFWNEFLKEKNNWVGGAISWLNVVRLFKTWRTKKICRKLSIWQFWQWRRRYSTGQISEQAIVTLRGMVEYRFSNVLNKQHFTFFGIYLVKTIPLCRGMPKTALPLTEPFKLILVLSFLSYKVQGLLVYSKLKNTVA